MNSHQSSATKFVLISALLVTTSAAQAAMYRWVDKNGAVHYTQTPPPADVKSDKVRPAPPPSAGSGGLKQYSENNDKASADKSKKDTEESGKRNMRETQCAEAKALMEKLHGQPMNRLAERDDNGNITRMTPEKFKELETEAQGGIDKHCDPQ